MKYKRKRRPKHKKGALLGKTPKRFVWQKEKRKDKETSRKCKVYDCGGFDCKSETTIHSSTHLNTHTGLCRSCAQRGNAFEASYNELYNRYGRHKREVSITYEEYYEMCQEKTCHYCLSELNRSPFTKLNGKEQVNSRSYMLDRKDNSLGYSLENVVNCCWKCNAAKGSRFTYDEWYGMTKYFRDKQKS